MGTNLWPTALGLIVTWWIHSSLLLGGAAAFSAWHQTHSPRWSEWLWKVAVVLPFLTAPLQHFGHSAFIIWRWEMVSSPVVETSPTPEKTSPQAFSPKSSSDPPQIISQKSTDWQIEIIPAEAPAIAEKSPAAFVPVDPLRHGFPAAKTANAPTGHLAEAPPAELPSLGRAGDIKRNSSRASEESPEEKAAAVPIEKQKNLSQAWPWFVPALAGGIFLIGFLGGCRFVWLLRSTRRILRRSRELSSGTAYRELHQLLQACGKRIRIRLAESEEIRMPAAGGVFRRVILLPANVEQQFPAEELRALLAHELGHHVRGDVRWLWFGRAICHLLPIQPLHFLAVKFWHQAAEPLCDDWAILQNVSPLALARSLTKAAQWPRAGSAIGPAAIGKWSRLTCRVERLLDQERAETAAQSRRGMIALTVLLASIMMMGSPQVLLPSKPSNSEPRTTPPAGSEHRNSPLPKAKYHRKQTPTIGSENSIPPDILNDLEITTTDLERALGLLEVGGEDPELLQVVDQLRNRLNTLRITSDRIEAADTPKGTRSKSD